MSNELVLVFNYGFHYTQQLAIAIRNENIYTEIAEKDMSPECIKQKNPKAIIICITAEHEEQYATQYINIMLSDLHIPIMALYIEDMASIDSEHAKTKEQIEKNIGFTHHAHLLEDVASCECSYCSGGSEHAHVDNTSEFSKSSFGDNTLIDNSVFSVMKCPAEDIEKRETIETIKDFLVNTAHLSETWTVAQYVEETIARIKEKVGNDDVILGLSGGVDSSVTAALIYKAIGSQLKPFFIDTGLMRKNEAQKVSKAFKEFYEIELEVVDASEIFLSRLVNVTDPEQKRKIIGHTFIEVFEKESAKYPAAKWLAQGTLYPDVLESLSSSTGAKVKSHHNVAGLPDKMKYNLLEPLYYLFKDEVRKVGLQLGVPESIVYRHPFPGPGLSVRIVGEVTKDKVKCLQHIDEIFLDELATAGYHHKVWQAFAVLLPVSSVGMRDGKRSYEQACALRAVNSVSGMTAEVSDLPLSLLKHIAGRIIAEVCEVNRVVYDITSKPPGTIEWE
jgi:GMP synthase (glutamine-hydrolysing)